MMMENDDDDSAHSDLKPHLFSPKVSICYII